MANYKGYTRKQVNDMINQYILSIIPTHEEIKSERDVITTNDAERLAFVMSCFNSEYNYEQNIKLYPNTQDRVKEWFMGLPSAINIDYENYRIIELGREWGLLPTVAIRIPAKNIVRKEDKFIANWFSAMAFKFLSLHDKMNKKKISEQPMTGASQRQLNSDK